MRRSVSAGSSATAHRCISMFLHKLPVSSYNYSLVGFFLNPIAAACLGQRIPPDPGSVTLPSRNRWPRDGTTESPDPFGPSTCPAGQPKSPGAGRVILIIRPLPRPDNANAWLIPSRSAFRYLDARPHRRNCFVNRGGIGAGQSLVRLLLPPWMIDRDLRLLYQIHSRFKTETWATDTDRKQNGHHATSILNNLDRAEIEFLGYK